LNAKQKESGMAHPAVIALSRSEAQMLLQQSERKQVKAIISICGQREFPVDAPSVVHKLMLHFDDVEPRDVSKPQGAYQDLMRQRWEAETGLTTTPPTIGDAAAIIRFAQTISDIDGMLLCQCHAGISRSPAGAILCLATWLGEGREQECVAEVLRIRPAARPLTALIAFGDQLLGRRGLLLEALAKGGTHPPRCDVR
jgi:predicted protein tyrosine phosphatase